MSYGQYARPFLIEMHYGSASPAGSAAIVHSPSVLLVVRWLDLAANEAPSRKTKRQFWIETFPSTSP